MPRDLDLDAERQASNARWQARELATYNYEMSMGGWERGCLGLMYCQVPVWDALS